MPGRAVNPLNHRQKLGPEGLIALGAAHLARAGNLGKTGPAGRAALDLLRRSLRGSLSGRPGQQAAQQRAKPAERAQQAAVQQVAVALLFGAVGAEMGFG